MTKHERRELGRIADDLRLATRLHEQHTMETATYHDRVTMAAQDLDDLRHGKERQK